MNPGETREEPLRVAVVGLMPDFGHVAPLLRIARAASAAGHAARCFVPEDARPLVEHFGLAASYAPSPRPADADEVLRTVADGGGWPRSVVVAETMKDRYLVPTHLAIHESLEQIARSLASFAPDVVVADDLGEVRPTVRALAARLDAPLLLHSAFGSRITEQSDAIRRWGAPERWWTRVAAWADRRIRTWRSRLRRVFAPERWRSARDARLRLEKAIQRAREGGVPGSSTAEVSFTTGLGVLESTALEGAIRVDDERLYLGPVDPERPASLDEPLAGWLEASDRTVVFLSFGTHLRPAPEELAAVLEGIHAAGVRCLWSTRGDQALGERFGPEELRIESFVSQPTVLAHPVVTAFATHAGSGGIQESLWFGVPLLCIPIQWDQHYNAVVVERLGCGITMPRRRITPDRVRDAIADLVGRARYTRRAGEVGAELRAFDGAAETVRLIEGMAAR